jgi:phasin family protein
MFNMRDHFSDASQASLASQLDFGTGLSGIFLDSTKRLADLHVNIARANLESVELTVEELLSTDSPSEFAAVLQAHLQPAGGKLLAYQCHLASIGVAAESDMTELVGERISARTRNLAEFLADMADSAVSGNRSLTIMRILAELEAYGCDHVTESTKRLLDGMEIGLRQAANQLAHLAYDDWPLQAARH